MKNYGPIGGPNAPGPGRDAAERRVAEHREREERRATGRASTQCKCGHIGEDHRLPAADSPVDPGAKFRCVGHMTEGGVWIDSKCDCSDFDPGPTFAPAVCHRDARGRFRRDTMSTTWTTSCVVCGKRITRTGVQTTATVAYAYCDECDVAWLAADAVREAKRITKEALAMTVYVDEFPAGWGKWTGGGHMLASDLDELHAMADGIGLKREWFQDKTFAHYDVQRSKRRLAIAAGAVVIPTGRVPDDVLMKCRDGSYETYGERMSRGKVRRAACLSPSTVVQALDGVAFRFTTEDELQQGIYELLCERLDGTEVTREVILGPRDRVDVMAAGVAVEVKIAGTAAAVHAQMERYAVHDRVTGLVLVTSRVSHMRLPAEMSGKPTAGFCIAGGGL